MYVCMYVCNTMYKCIHVCFHDVVINFNTRKKCHVIRGLFLCVFSGRSRVTSPSRTEPYNYDDHYRVPGQYYRKITTLGDRYGSVI